MLRLTLSDDYRWPVPEVLAFVFTLSTFLLADFSLTFYTAHLNDETIPYVLASSVLGQLPLFVLVALLLKNVALGLGGDLEKGVIQTYLSYPLKRYSILSAKLISSLTAFAYFATVQVSGLALLTPNVVFPHLGTILITYAANLQTPLLAGALMLLLTLRVRRSGQALVLGLVSYFALILFEALGLTIATRLSDPIGLQMISVIFPSVALGWYFGAVPTLGQTFPATNTWNPPWSDVLFYLGMGYTVMFLVLILGCIYFSKRVGL